MPSQRPPTIDPVAAQRWSSMPGLETPWLHEEVARRMRGRLDLILKQPASWVHWHPLQGGMQVHGAIVKKYPKADCFVFESQAPRARLVAQLFAKRWWNSRRWIGPQEVFAYPQSPVDMLWSNMGLHMAADPQAWIAKWHECLAVGGFLMFSCFGPDTLIELRGLYKEQAWPPPSHEFTDMHDWGDMLVQAGFAEPVMDMERITLTFASAERMLLELRGLGRNLHRGRFEGLRGRTWHGLLLEGLKGAATGNAGQHQLTFEIIYGHAFKAAPRFAVMAESHVPLTQLKGALRRKV